MPASGDPNAGWAALRSVSKRLEASSFDAGHS
jgi:hypothetical protein